MPIGDFAGLGDNILDLYSGCQIQFEGGLGLIPRVNGQSSTPRGKTRGGRAIHPCRVVGKGLAAKAIQRKM